MRRSSRSRASACVRIPRTRVLPFFAVSGPAPEDSGRALSPPPAGARPCPDTGPDAPPDGMATTWASARAGHPAGRGSARRRPAHTRCASDAVVSRQGDGERPTAPRPTGAAGAAPPPLCAHARAGPPVPSLSSHRFLRPFSRPSGVGAGGGQMWVALLWDALPDFRAQPLSSFTHAFHNLSLPSPTASCWSAGAATTGPPSPPASWPTNCE